MIKRVIVFVAVMLLVACQPTSLFEPTSTAFVAVLQGTPLPTIYEPITGENAHLISQLTYWETELFTDEVVNFSLDSQYLLVGRHGRLTTKFDISTGTTVSAGVGDDNPRLYPSDIRNDRSYDGSLTVFEYYVAGITVGEFIIKNTSELNRVFVEQEYTALSLFPNGEHLVIVLEGKKVQVIPIDFFGPKLFGIDSEYPTSEKRRIDDTGITFEAQKQVSSVITTPDNNFIIIVYEDNTIQRVDVSTLNVINEFKLKDLPNTRRFLPGSTIIAFGFPDQSIELWDVNSGRQVTVLEGHAGRIRDLAFSPDGRFLASLNNESNVFLWGILPAQDPEQAVLTSTALAHRIPTATNLPNAVVGTPESDLTIQLENFPFQWPPPEITSDLLEQAKDCNVEDLAQKRYKESLKYWEIASAHELESACDWSLLAHAYWKYYEEEEFISEEAILAYSQAVALNPAFALKKPFFYTFFGEVESLSDAPPVTSQEITNISVNYDWGGIGDPSPVIYQIDISNAHLSFQQINVSISGEPEDYINGLNSEFSPRLIQALGSALTDLIPIQEQFSLPLCSDNYSNWRIALTFADGQELVVTDNGSNFLHAGGPWFVEIDGQDYVQVSPDFLIAVLDLLEGMNLPIGQPWAQACHSIDPFHLAYPSP